MGFKIRLVNESEIDLVMPIYDEARYAIASLGIDQWQGGYPEREVVLSDIRKEMLYAAVSEENGNLAALAVLMPSPDHNYDKIDGEWLTDGEYMAIHRVAASDEFRGRGASGVLFSELFGIVRSKGVSSVRIDTHRGNTVMQRFVEKHGFKRCGIITLLENKSGDPLRVAYEILL